MVHLTVTAAQLPAFWQAFASNNHAFIYVDDGAGGTTRAMLPTNQYEDIVVTFETTVTVASLSALFALFVPVARMQ
jgi:hypothetical protein